MANDVYGDRDTAILMGIEAADRLIEMAKELEDDCPPGCCDLCKDKECPGPRSIVARHFEYFKELLELVGKYNDLEDVFLGPIIVLATTFIGRGFEEFEALSHLISLANDGIRIEVEKDNAKDREKDVNLN